MRIVNGKHRDDTPDFDATAVWAILVGGTKLSRGYTVEGLTVSYYRRPTGAGDTLMQMGRWFGFRFGYSDLVRLFIGRQEKRGRTVLDLYEAFGAVCRDEEALREDLRKYASQGLTPWKVPPLVRQHLAELPPTSRAKMFNAEIKSLDYAGDWTEKTSATSNRDQMLANLRSAHLLIGACKFGELSKVEFQNADGKRRRFEARIGTTSAEAVLTFLKTYEWADQRKPIQLEIDYITNALQSGTLKEWLVVLPQLGDALVRRHNIPTVGEVSVILRSRVSNSRFGVYSEPRHVEAAKAIAGVTQVSQSSETLRKALGANLPVLVMYFVAETANKNSDLTIGFGIQYPGVKRETAIQWTARRADREGEVVVAERSTIVARKGPAKKRQRR